MTNRKTLSGIVFYLHVDRVVHLRPQKNYLLVTFFQMFANNMEPLQQVAGLEARTFEWSLMVDQMVPSGSLGK